MSSNGEPEPPAEPLPPGPSGEMGGGFTGVLSSGKAVPFQIQSLSAILLIAPLFPTIEGAVWNFDANSGV